MENPISFAKKTLNINQKNNRFVLKLFGEMNHNYITIEKDEILTISKMREDHFEKKGQITKWKFNLDRIYPQNTTFDELYENEIENTDFIHDFNKKSQYNTIIFIGDKNDSLTKIPYSDFILKCIKECLSDKNINLSLIPILSFCELNKSFVIDYLGENTSVKKLKLNKYEDDIQIEGINYIKISNENEFASLINLAKKNIDNFNINKYKEFANNKSSLTQIMTLKLIKSNTNECYSKINFVLYKAYEILEENDSNSYGNCLYNIYTKDNYNFFKGVKNCINYRLSYALKCLRDTLIKGNNLFIIALPCEYQYLLLIHDLLDNINMRKLIIENIIVDEQDNINNNDLGEYYKCNNNSEINDNENLENIYEVSSFQSFSKNNSINTNNSSIFYKEVKNKKNIYNSCMLNEYTQPKKKRMELNIERLSKINERNNIIKLFELFDKRELNEYKTFNI